MNETTRVVGVFPTLTGAGGGIYQYSLAVLHALEALVAPDGSYHVFTEEPASLLSGRFRLARAEAHRWPAPPLTRVADRVEWALLGRRRRHVGNDRGSRAIDRTARNRSALRRWVASTGTELLLFPQPSVVGFETGLPYVMAVHDLQHRIQPEFPEVSAGGEWARREYLFACGIAHAHRVLVDSEVGKEDVLDLYGDTGVTPDRIVVLPFVPAPYGAPPSEEHVRGVRARYGLPERFFFYPAQFWPHKNHLRLVEAVGRLRRSGIDAPLVLVGSAAGPLRTEQHELLLEAARRFACVDLVHVLGYVPDEDMSSLYSCAVALAMPTFFGPTNIPVIEAWSFGCPVLTSDIRGIREQCGDAAILVDPKSVSALVEALAALWTDADLRTRLRDLGRRRTAGWTQQDFTARLAAALAPSD